MCRDLLLTQATMTTQVIVIIVLVNHHVLDFALATPNELILDFRVHSHVLESLMQIFFSLPIMYVVNLWFIKFALLAFYNRIFFQYEILFKANSGRH